MEYSKISTNMVWTLLGESGTFEWSLTLYSCIIIKTVERKS